MHKNIPAYITFLLCLLLAASATAQTKKYELVRKAERSNFNYKAIRRINTYDVRKEVFEPVRGKFTVYTFIANFRGVSKHTDKDEDFHDILIIKTDKKDRILDAYQYTLEWAEMPLTYDLFRLTAKNITLSNGLSLDSLKLMRVETTDEDNRPHKEKGVILLSAH